MSEQAHLIGSEIIRQIKSVTPPAKDLEALAISVFDSFALELPERQRLLGDPDEDGVGLFSGRGQSPDLRHNAFGLFCGVLDNHLRECYQPYDREVGRGQGILAGQTELKPDKFRHIFTGYEVKRQGETLYSYRQLIGTEETEVSPLERNAGFLRRFLYFTLLAQAADSERATRIGLLQNGAYSLAYLWVLDAVANPRATLWAVQQAEEHSDQFSMVIGEVGRRLRSLLGKFLYQSGAGWQQPESDRQEPLHVPVMHKKVFEILAFSLAKCIYDGNALTRELPIFLTQSPDDFSAAPVLNFTEGDNPSDTLWTQFNRLVFLRMPYRQRDVRANWVEPTEMDVTIADNQSRSAADDLPYIYLRQNIGRWTTVGLRGNTPFNDLQVSYARINLPDFNYRWTTSNLKRLCVEFEDFVRVDESSSHLVFLVGPFGTGKTTMAQVMTQHLTDQNDWFILAYHPETALFGFDWLTKEDTAETFRRNELSRLMMGMKEDIFGHIRYELPFDRRIIVNLSELNAADPDQITKVQLPIIENLLREIKEKLLPREVVFFISLQMYQLASELQHFFERKPDLAMGRARVDTAWLVRGDCYQYLNRDQRTSFKEQYLARFAAYFAGGPSHLTRRAVSNALMNLETKARSSLIKVTALEAALKEDQPKDKVASRVLETFGLMRELDIPEPQDYLAAWGHTPVFQRAFRLGFGNYTTTTISLANGFIRQTIDIIKNEFELLLKEWEVIEKISQKPRRDAAKRLENLARSELVDLLASVQTSRARFYYLVGEELWKGLGEKAKDVARRLDTYSDLYKSAFGNPVTVTGQVFTGQESGNFDIGFVLESRDQGSRLHFLVDLTKNVAGRDNKGMPSTPRVMLTWRNGTSDDNSEPIGISLGQFLAALGRLSSELLDEEGIQHVFQTPEGRAGVVRVDCQVDDTLQVPSFALTIFLKEGTSEDRVRAFAADLITELARLEKLYDRDVDFRPFDWTGKHYPNGRDEKDLHVADEALHTYLLDRWTRALHLIRLYLPGFGDKRYLKSSPSVKTQEQLYLLTPETLTAAGVTSKNQQHILETAGSWVTDFVCNRRVDGVQVDRLFTSLPLKGLSPTASVEVWNDALRLIYFLYANCLVDAPNREWLLLPEGEFAAAVRCHLKAEDLSDWLSKSKWHEPEDRAIPHKVEERCEKLTARYGERRL